MALKTGTYIVGASISAVATGNAVHYVRNAFHLVVGFLLLWISSSVVTGISVSYVMLLAGRFGCGAGQAAFTGIAFPYVDDNAPGVGVFRLLLLRLLTRSLLTTEETCDVALHHEDLSASRHSIGFHLLLHHLLNTFMAVDHPVPCYADGTPRHPHLHYAAVSPGCP